MSETFVIPEQRGLGLQRLLLLTLGAIRYRLFRSLTTVLVVTVAVTFLVRTVVSGLLEEAYVKRLQTEEAELRLASLWLSRLTQPVSPAYLLEEFAKARDASALMKEAERFGPLAVEEVRTLPGNATTALQYADFFSALDPRTARELGVRNTGVEVFDLLQGLAEFNAFTSALERRKRLRFPSDMESFRNWLGSWPEMKVRLEKIALGRNKAVAQLRKELPAKEALNRLKDASGKFGEKIRAAGFELSPAQAEKLSLRAEEEALAALIAEAVSKPALARTVASRLDLDPRQIGGAQLWRFLHNKANARWLLEQWQAAGSKPVEVTAEKLYFTAQRQVALARLEQARNQLERSSSESTEQSNRTLWLLCVATLVCAIGIANALFMSVTERYREIATLKCLGALPGTVLALFILEAMALGTAGGITGALLGSLFAILSTAGTLGGSALQSAPWSAVAAATASGALLSILIAMLAAGLPAWSASRLAPMLAMRVR